MEVNSICIPYREYNEDAVIVIKDHLFIVIDAATGLGEPFHKPSDGVYLLNCLKEEILRLYRSGKLTPKNFVAKMNTISSRLYRRYVKGHDKLERYQFPSASIAVCYIDMINVHIYSIGDVSTFVRLKNGDTQYISDKSIPIMDREVRDYYHAQGITDFDEMYEKLRYNRTLLNRNGRKPSYSLYKRPHLKFKHYKFDIRKLNDIYLCSDGYYDAFEDLKLFKSRKELFSYKHDLQDVYKLILEESKKPNTLKEHPRLKKIDDVSAIRVTF